jgi:Protein of unknown function (DUF3306)
MSEAPKDIKREGNFLDRWSSRKQQAKAAPVAPEPASMPQPVEDAPFDLSLLPKLEDLTGESDLSVFLQKGVPESIKNAAMRRVWALDSGIANYLGPVDYAWDFNDPAGIPGFGPLGAEVDVAGMLKQVMGEREPPTEALGAPEPAALEAVPEPTASVRRHDKPVLLPPDHAEMVLAPQTAQDREPDAETAAPPLRKRHGGAVPS